MNTLPFVPALYIDTLILFQHLNGIIKTVLFCIHYEFYKRGREPDHFHRPTVGLTVLTLIGFIERLIGITISKLELVDVNKPKAEETVGWRRVGN